MDETALEIEQGSTWFWSVVWTDDQGAPIDLTGAVACMQMRTTYYAPDVVLELDVDNGRIVIEPTTGTLTMLVDAATTALLTTRSGVYDLEVKFANGVIEKLLRGPWLLIPEVTRCL